MDGKPLDPGLSLTQTGSMSPKAKMGLIAVVFVGAILVATGVVVALVVGRPWEKKEVTRPLIGAPTEEKEGEKWSIDELVAYLRARGMTEAESVDVRDEKRRGGRFIRFGPLATDEHLLKAEHHELKFAVRVATYLLTKSASNKDMASDQNRKHPGTALGWGRFLFIGDPAYIANMKAALVGS